MVAATMGNLVSPSVIIPVMLPCFVCAVMQKVNTKRVNNIMYVRFICIGYWENKVKSLIGKLNESRTKI